MNDVVTYATTTSYFDRNSRLRAIAMNTIREGVIAFGRVDRPFTDSDAATMDNVYNLLAGLGEEQAVGREYEHQNLSVEGTSPAASQAQIANILAGFDPVIRTEGRATDKSKAASAKA
jgi:hypothetical protein